MLADVRAGASDLATLSVAMPEIRDLIEATSSAAQVGSEPTERPVAPVRA